MVYTCCVEGCESNYPGTNGNISVFKFPKDTDLSKRWERFAAGTDKMWRKKKTSRICINRFAPRYIIQIGS